MSFVNSSILFGTPFCFPLNIVDFNLLQFGKNQKHQVDSICHHGLLLGLVHSNMLPWIFVEFGPYHFASIWKTLIIIDFNMLLWTSIKFS
jgi:hypothetical protein